MIPNAWYALLESKKLGSKPVGVERLGEKWVVWRDAAGSPVIQADRCVHKAAQLSLGTVEDGCIQCPYHGLRYNSAGRCTLVPFMDRDYSIPKGWAVETLQARESCGLIWAWYGADPPGEELPWFEGLPRSQRRSWQTSSIWPYHYSRLMDSNFDVYHFPFVHRSFNPGMGPVVSEYEVEDEGELIRTRTTLDAYRAERRGRRARKSFVIHVRMPNLMYLEISKRLWLLAIMTPVDEARTWVFARYFANMPLGGLVAWVAGRFEYKLVQDQDKRVLDSLPKGSLEVGEYRYGKVDAGSILWLKKRARRKAEASEKAK